MLRPILGAVTLFLCMNEAFSSESALRIRSQAELGLKSGAELRIRSKQEIMANMSAEVAIKIVMSMKRVHLEPKLSAILRSKLGRLMRSGAYLHAKNTLRGVRAHGSKAEEDPQKGYAALDKARLMLNSMMEEANMKLELEEIKCHDFDGHQMQLMSETQQDVSSFNSLAAEARGHVLKAQGAVMLINTKSPKIREEHDELLKRCTMDVSNLKATLAIVTADIQVMTRVLELTKCGGSTSNGTTALIQCPHCKNPDGSTMIMLQGVGGEEGVQPLLSNLRSAVARQYVQTNLARTYHEAVSERPAIMLTQEAVRHAIRVTKRGASMQAANGSAERSLQDTLALLKLHGSGRKVEEHAQLDQDPAVTTAAPSGYTTLGMPPANALNTSDKPTMPAHFDCVPTTQCRLGETPDCFKLLDRFLLIQAGILDKKNELSNDLVKLEDYCETTGKSYEAQIQQLEDQLREEQTNLAMSTKDQVDSESQSRIKGEQFEDLKKEYEETMSECCDNQNELKSEMCALEKIRGELFKMEGQKVFITDCEVSEWKPEECSVTCGGGVQVKTRSIIAQPNGGTACPPLRMESACNTLPCPVNCVLEDWNGWSACTAECGGGVRMRARSIRIESQHGGDACGATEEEEPCNLQSCDADCVLSDWVDWSPCSKACGTGNHRRTRGVNVPAVGTGVCPPADAAARMQFDPCNEHTCESVAAAKGRDKILCNSRVDVVLVVDGSGSLGKPGWDRTKMLTQVLARQFLTGNASVNLAIQLFSGPLTWDAYERCTGVKTGRKVDIQKDCGIWWVTHFSNDTNAVLTAVNAMVWPSATTLTSLALAEAESELTYGRQDANAVVIVVTDGRPMSNDQTKEAALKLQQHARLIWVPVGSAAPIDLIREMASKPEDDHVVIVDKFDSMVQSSVLNKIVADSCPIVG